MRCPFRQSDCRAQDGCTLTDVQVFLNIIKYLYPHTASVNRTQVDIIHAHVFTHNDPCGSFQPLALIDALMPQKLGDPAQPSTSLADYTISQWEDTKKGDTIVKGVANQDPRKDGKTYIQCGTYTDHAQF